MTTQNLKIEVKADPKPIADLNKKLKEAKEELVRLELAGQKNTKAYSDQASKISTLNGRLHGLNKSYKEAANSSSQTSKAVEQTSISAQKAGTAFQNMGVATSIGLAAIAAGITSLGTDSLRAANDLDSANRKLLAASKLTGTNFEFLQKTAKDASLELGLTAGISNQLTVSLVKLGNKAGDVGKTSEAIRSLMDLGAAQGLNAEETLTAIQQAILGIDEGTDKLFQKNPSVIYEEYANAIGTTAGKLSDQEKAQALLNAVLEDGTKVRGEYLKYLDSFAGKQDIANQKFEVGKQLLGKYLQESLIPIFEYTEKYIGRMDELSKKTESMGKNAQTAGEQTGTFLTSLISLGEFIQKIDGYITPGLGALESLYNWAKDATEGILEMLGLINQVADSQFEKKTVGDRVDEAVKKIQGAIIPEIVITPKEEKEKKRTRSGTSQNKTTEKAKELLTAIDEIQKKITEKQEIQSLYSNKGLTTTQAYLTLLEEIVLLETQLATLRGGAVTSLEAMNVPRLPIGEVSFTSTTGVEEALQAERDKAIEDGKMIYGNVTNILSTLGLATDNFVGKIVSGFNSVLAIMESIKAINSILNVIPFLATGGIMQQSGLAVVGERGAELVQLPAGARVYNNQDTQKYFNSINSQPQAVNVYVNANLDGLKFLENNMPKYFDKRNFKRIN